MNITNIEIETVKVVKLDRLNQITSVWVTILLTAYGTIFIKPLVVNGLVLWLVVVIT